MELDASASFRGGCWTHSCVRARLRFRVRASHASSWTTGKMSGRTSSVLLLVIFRAMRAFRFWSLPG